MASRTRSATKGRRPAWATGLRIIEDEGRPARHNDEVVSVTSVTGEVVSVTSATGEVVSVTSATGDGARAPDANAMPQADAPADAGTAPSEHEDAESEAEDNVVVMTSPSAAAQGMDLPRTSDMPEWKQPTEQEAAAAPLGATCPNIRALPLTVYDC